MQNVNQRSLAKFNRLIETNSELIKKDTYCLQNFSKIKTDETYLHSLAVSITVLMEYYPVTFNAAIQSLTEEGKDSGIDLMYFDESEIYEEAGQKYINLILIQSKYKKNSNSTESAIKESDIQQTLITAQNIINGKEVLNCGSLLSSKIQKLRKISEDNEFPIIQCFVYFATNGRIDSNFSSLQNVLDVEDSIKCEFISNANFGKQPQVKKQTKIKVLGQSLLKETPEISGCIVETSLKNLIEFYEENGEESLLASNVRYLLPKSNINKQIKLTAQNSPELFWFYNNGISIISKSPLQKSEKTSTEIKYISLTEPTIVNGGQTTASIYQLYKNKQIDPATLEKASVIIRIYNTADENIVYNIAQATNSQNPINVIDLRSNNPIQKMVVKSFEEKGVALIVKAGQDLTDCIVGQITNESLLQMYAALYGSEPAKARTSKRTIFNKYFDQVFTLEEYNNEMPSKLYRCFEINDFLAQKEMEYNKDTKIIIEYAKYSIAYCMQLLDPLILKGSIPKKLERWNELFEKSYSIMSSIIQKRQDEMKEKFSLNNLFKGKDIQVLISNAVIDNHAN